MWPYWLMFLLPAGASFFRVRSARAVMWLGWGIMWLMLTLLIGYRYEVGGDWSHYLDHVNETYGLSFVEAMQLDDPAHGALNWISNTLGWGVYGTNLVYGAIFSAGLIAFCHHQPRPLLALAIAMPYLVVVVAMGYSRQSVAIGLVLFALLTLVERNTSKFVIIIVIAALFHKSAVVLIPVAALASNKRKVWTTIWVGVTAVLMYFMYLAESVDTLAKSYLEAEYESQGATIRIAMNTVPALLFLIYRNRFHLYPTERLLWTWIALIALACVPILVVSPSSTAVDRLALYFIPLQIYVFSRLPMLWRGQRRLQVQGLVVFYYGLVFFVWLNFASHSQYWLPYRFYPLVLLAQ